MEFHKILICHFANRIERQ